MRNTDMHNRYNNYDLLRIISIISVVVIHVNWIYLENIYDEPRFDNLWIFTSTLNIITRFSVPALTMISGAFNLEKEKNADFSLFYMKIVKKIVFPTMIITVIYLIVHFILHEDIFLDLKKVIKGGFCNLWYINMLLGLYFLTPYIIRLKQAIKWEHYKLLAYVMVIWAIISQATSDEKLSYSIGVCVAFLSYYLMGDVIKTEIEKGWNPNKCLLIIVSLICVALTFLWRSMGNYYYISKAYINFFSPTIFIFSLCVFALFAVVKINKDYSWFAKISFEVYLFHTLVLDGILPIIQDRCFYYLVEELTLVVTTLIVSLIFAMGYSWLWSLVSRKISFNRMIENCKIWKIFE